MVFVEYWNQKHHCSDFDFWHIRGKKAKKSHEQSKIEHHKWNHRTFYGDNMLWIEWISDFPTQKSFKFRYQIKYHILIQMQHFFYSFFFLLFLYSKEKSFFKSFSFKCDFIFLWRSVFLFGYISFQCAISRDKRQIF